MYVPFVYFCLVEEMSLLLVLVLCNSRMPWSFFCEAIVSMAGDGDDGAGDNDLSRQNVVGDEPSVDLGSGGKTAGERIALAGRRQLATVKEGHTFGKGLGRSELGL
jgi:hypothetical protein